MNLTVQHLSDEAVAAFADGVLSTSAQARASKHLAECPDCAHSVAEQRAAVWALRAAPAPSLPGGLLDRLRSLPATTALPSSSLPSSRYVLAPDGSPMFASYGMSGDQHLSLFARLMPSSLPARRRGQHMVLATAALALVAMGTVGSSAEAATPHPSVAQPASQVAPSGQR